MLNIGTALVSSVQSTPCTHEPETRIPEIKLFRNNWLWPIWAFLMFCYVQPAAAQMYPMKDFIGINALREDPVKYFDCAGFLREYHDWQIDQGDFYKNDPSPKLGENCYDGVDNDGDSFVDCADNECACASDLYPYNLFKWRAGYQGQSNENFSDFYQRAGDYLEGSSTISADMHFCISQLAGGKGVFREFKPIRTSLSVLINSPTTDTLPNTFPINIEAPNSTEPSAYVDYADWVHHFSKAFGAGNATAFGADIYKCTDGTAQAQQKVKYVEIWNEQNKTWYSNPFYFSGGNPMTQFSPQEYAAMASYTYDGWSGMAHDSADYGDLTKSYHLGVRYADPTMKYVFGGLSEIGDADWNYVMEVKAWCDSSRGSASGKVFPFDVLNFHHYSDGFSNGFLSSDSKIGLSPESDYLTNSGSLYDTSPMLVSVGKIEGGVLSQVDIKKSFKYRLREIKGLVNQHFGPDMELWLSEFGYDTDPISPIRTPVIPANPLGENAVSDQQEVQGRWLVRAYLEIAAAGWDRAVAFNIRDTRSDKKLDDLRVPFDACGLVKDRTSNFAPKKAYYYVKTLGNVLGELKFTQELNSKVKLGNVYYTNEFGKYEVSATKPRQYVFQPSPSFGSNGVVNLSSGDVVAVWLPTSSNEHIESYDLYFPNIADDITQVTVISMMPGDANGVQSVLPIINGTIKRVQISVTEKPVFVVMGIAQADPVVVCPTMLPAKALSCEAVKINWEIPEGQTYDSYRVYYYNKRDSEEGGATPHFDIADPNWVLYTDELPGDKTSVVIAGLDKKLDDYFVAVVGVKDGSIPTTVCDLVKIEPTFCHASYIPLTSMLNPSEEVQELFHYDDVVFCYPQRKDMAPAWTNKDSLIITFDDQYIIDAIAIYDANGQGTIRIEADDDNQNEPDGSFATTNPLLEYYTFYFKEWSYFPVTKLYENGIKRLRLSKIDDGQINRIVLYGHKTAESDYPTPDCCTLPSSVTVGNSPTAVTNLSTVAALANSNMVVEGSLKIDVDNFTFDGAQIIVKPGGEIILPEGKTLFLKNTTIRGCDAMWKGLKVAYSARLFADNIAVRDAEKAVKVLRVKDNWLTTKTFWSIKNSVFEENKYGLYVEPSNNFPYDYDDLSVAAKVEDCIFDGNGINLKPTFAGQQDWPLRSSLEGITLNQVAYTTASSDSSKLIFSRLERGIVGKNTTLILNAPYFRDITVNYNQDPNSGIGIKGYQLSVYCNGFDYPSIDPTPSIINPPSFNRVSNCFDLYGGTHELQWMKMEKVGQGIRLTHTRDANIHDNFIYPKSQGIALDRTLGSTIKDNTIINKYAATVSGISMTGYTGSSPIALSTIQHNTIEIKCSNKAQPAWGAGIYLLAINGIIEDNVIRLKDFDKYTGFPESPLIHGIRLENATRGSFVCSNDVKGWVGTVEGDNEYGIGIGAINSSLAKMSCNTLNSIGSGLEFTMSCTSVDAIKGNEMADYDIGLHLKQINEASANIGEQSYNGNRWLPSGETINDAQFDFFNNDEIEINEFHVGSSEPPLFPTTVSPSTWFEYETEEADFVCPTNHAELDCYSDIDLFANLTKGGLYDRIATGTYHNSNQSETYLRMMQRNAYAAIAASYPDANYPAPYQAFMHSVAAKNIGKFSRIDTNIDAILAGKTSTSEQITRLLAEKKAILDTATRTLVAYQQLTEIELLTALDNPNSGLPQAWTRIQDITKQVDALYETLRTDKLKRISETLELNRAIVPQQPEDAYEQDINSIFLAVLQRDTTTFVEKQTLETVQAIAARCPQTDGYGVFRARAIWLMTGQQYDPTWDNCYQSSSNTAATTTRPQDDIATTQATLSVFPNPAHDLLTLAYSTTTQVTFTLTDMLGRTVKTAAPINGTANINTADLPQGMYICKVWQKGSLQTAKTVMILR